MPEGKARDALVKPLKLELKKGCADTATAGSMAGYLRQWLANYPGSGPVVAKVGALASAYPSLGTAARKEAITGILALFEGTAPAAKAPVLAASVAPAVKRQVTPMAIGPDTPVARLAGIGARRANAFKQLGVANIEDLLYHFPRVWQDRSNLIDIIAAKPGMHVTLKGKVRGAATFRAGGRMMITEIGVQDGTGVIFAMYFNQPFRRRQFVVGSTVIVSGKVEARGSHLQIMNPEAEVLPEGDEQLIHSGRVVPIYPLTREISQKVLRQAVWDALDCAARVPDAIPERWANEMGLAPLAESLRQIHFPDSEEQRLRARNRLVFDEFFVVGLGMAMRKAGRKAELGAMIPRGGALPKRLLKGLPFELTRAQLRVWSEIEDDLAKGEPMQRLVQGDVGSGKTLVAALALVSAVEQGYQAAMMAPTEILAEQHLINMRAWFEPLGIEVLPLKQGQKAAGRREVLAHLASGRPLVAVGTQALIQEGVEFGNLGLAVVDEQHRFGVLQRLGLAKKAKMRPHVLVMTATPIPRTLAMTAYGDLDVSIVDELPPGRTPVATRWLLPQAREEAYDAVRIQVQEGRQAYVIYGLVEESEKAERRAATQMAVHLSQDIFPEFKVELLHGRMKPEEKDAAMERFKSGKAQILCSTTVIEVGVDVPNATLMMIEDADRFGLAQLHQLRGRVGRGAARSLCYLIGRPNTEEGIKRLEAMVRTTDGFEIAEEDLRLRGPGEILGIRQSGIPDFKLASLVTDQAILAEAKARAEAVIKDDPRLESRDNAPLRDLVARRIEKKLQLAEVG
ncbi:MAG: ATP-dependent DNA helicase RecG [candidate division FCPU426 bacterium]